MRIFAAAALCLMLCAAPACARETGLAVVSDINNTMRADGPVPGMVDAYQRLAKQGAAFHYVSYATWRERAEIGAFVKQAGYPEGTLHLRTTGEGDDSLFDLLQPPSETKPPAIKKLLADYPKSDFILIGDSGAQDPEIYGRIARENKARIRHIYIRRVTAEKEDDPRYRKAFAGLDAQQWTLFGDPSVIGEK